MKIGLFTSGYQRYPLESVFSDAKAFGYDYIELHGARPHGYAPDILSDHGLILNSYQKKYKVPIKIYTPEHNDYPYNYMIGNEKQHADALKYLKSCMDASKVLNCEFMVISAGHAGNFKTRRDIWDRFEKSIKNLTTYAETIQLKLVLEALTPMESNVCTSAKDLEEILYKVPSDNLYGMLDLVPPFIQNEPIENYYKLLGDKLKHLHIVDSDGVSESHILPGDGVMPLDTFINQIKSWGYKGTATIELVSNYINEPSVYSKRAIDNIRPML